RAGNAESIQQPDEAPDPHPAAVGGPGLAGMIDRSGFEMSGLHRVSRRFVIGPGLEHHGHRDGDLLAVRPRQSACHHMLLQCAIVPLTTSVPIPKFASLCRSFICELLNRKDTSNLLI